MSFLNPAKIIHQSAIPKDGVVADFGFGQGAFLELLSREVGKDGKVYAIDIQKDIVEKVKSEFIEKNITNTEFLSVDLETEKSTKIADASLDFVLISALLFQVEAKEEVLKEAVRILKPNGRILFIEWKDSFSNIGPHEKDIFSEDEAIVLFKKFPVDLVRRIDSGLYHYALMYKKN